MANRIKRIVGIDQRQIVRRDGHTQAAQRFFHPHLLLFGQSKMLLELIQSFDAVGYLPMPIIPLFLGHIGKGTESPGFIFKYHGILLTGKRSWWKGTA